MSDITEQVHQAVEVIEEKAAEIREQVEDSAQEVAQQAQEVAAEVAEQVENGVERAEEKINHVVNPDDRVPKFYNGEPYESSVQRTTEKVEEIAKEIKEAAHDTGVKAKATLKNAPVNWIAIAGAAIAAVGLIAVVVSKTVKAH